MARPQVSLGGQDDLRFGVVGMCSKTFDLCSLGGEISS